MHRRQCLIATSTSLLPWAATAWAQNSQADDAARTLIADGGVVVAFRHALAPGTYDPPGFRLGECSTQRNLDDEGRAQARRIGAWFRTRSLVPATVRSSPWCRCVDTAQLAFGAAAAWPALGSPHAGIEEVPRTALDELRRAIAAAAERRGRFEAWVTHQFVLSALTGESTSSGEALLLTVDAQGKPKVAGRLKP